MRLFSTLPGELISLFRGLGNSADSVNAKAHLIGAYPRSILFREDCSDLEIVITGDVEKTASNFKAEQISYDGRTIIIPNPYSDGDIIKLTRARKNINGGIGDIRTESFCRGFSIDALAVSLNSHDFGNMIDYSGAVYDIQNRILRMLTRDLFYERPKYIFKAIEYKNKYNLAYDPITESLLNKAITEKLHLRLSKAEIRNELNAIKKEKGGKNIIKILKEIIGGGNNF